MSHLILLGDSIFDNAAYVGGGPAVIDQVREQLPDPWRATLCARDGSTIDGVHAQLERLPPDATHLAISAGGNDTLGEVGVLGARVGTVGEGVRLLAEIQGRFARDYHRLLGALEARRLPSLLCTIYHPRFHEPSLQREAETALSLFNDCIFRAARRFGRGVLDLRTVCTDAADYANPIEPSSAGGAKIARAIGSIVLARGFEAPRTVLWP